MTDEKMISVFAQTLGQNLPKVTANQATLNGVLNTIYGVIGALAVIFIIVGGIKYITSSGDSSKIASAKNTIQYAIIGLVVAILAFAITNFIVGALNVSSFEELRKSVVGTLFFIAGTLAVIMIVVGGFKYVTSGGDSSKVVAAKNTVLYAVIGLIFVILAYAVVNFVIGIL